MSLNKWKKVCSLTLRREWRLWSGLIHGSHSGFQLWRVTIKILCDRHKSEPTTAVIVCEEGLPYRHLSVLQRVNVWNSDQTHFKLSQYNILKYVISSTTYLFQVQCDCHVVVLHSILDGGTLPPTVGPIYGIFDGMTLCAEKQTPQ